MAYKASPTVEKRLSFSAFIVILLSLIPLTQGQHITLISSDEASAEFEAPANQTVIDGTALLPKRIAHGVITSVAFVLGFPTFALLLHIMPSPHTATRIHAPLQIATVCLALAGFGVGLSIANDLNELRSYHPIIGYVAIGGVVLVQPFLGIMGRRLYRNTKTPSLYGMSHRWLGRLFTAIGIINGGFGFYYAYPINPDIPAASPIAYGAICAGVGIIYVSVLIWRRRKTKRVGQC